MKPTTQEIETPIWQKYVPDTCYLYYVDYNDNLDDQHKLLQECLDKNNMFPFSESVFDWWEFPEQYEIEDIKRKMEADGLGDEFEEYYEDIREWLFDHDKSTPEDDLFCNTGDVTMYYSCGLELDHGWREAFLCNPWQNESCDMAAYKVRRYLGIKKDTQEAKDILTMCQNSSYGGELRIYFRGDIRDFISGDNYDDSKDKRDFKILRLRGEVTVAVYSSGEGSGDFVKIKVDRDIPFDRENLRISSLDRYSIESCFGMYEDWCETSGTVEPTIESPKNRIKRRVSEKLRQEKHYEEVFNNGGCSPEDPSMSRHRNVEYRNLIPCGWYCPHCGREWLD